MNSKMAGLCTTNENDK